MQVAKSAGFDAIEMSIGNDFPLEITTDDAHRLRDDAHKAGIAIATLWVSQPLSENPLDPSIGTRHRAGLGITELTDALSVVVSEETGIISLANNGRMVRNLDEGKLRKYIKQTCITDWHPSGTCKMGPDTDPLAVVDARLRVKGIDGLRVVDASIMPAICSGNTNAPTIMIGEKAADMIREDARAAAIAA